MLPPARMANSNMLPACIVLSLLPASLALYPEARPPARPRVSASPTPRVAAPTPRPAAYRNPEMYGSHVPLPPSSLAAGLPSADGASAADEAGAHKEQVDALERKLAEMRADLNQISADFEGLLTTIAAEPHARGPRGMPAEPALASARAPTVGDALAALAAERENAPTCAPPVTAAPCLELEHKPARAPAAPAMRAAPGGPNISVRIVGVGGSGGNTINRVAEHIAPFGTDAVRTLAVNTDAQVLGLSAAHETLLIGAPADSTGGRRQLGQGAGGNPAVGAAAALAHATDVAAALDGADMVFVTGGMGGGTGSGAAPEIARIARAAGALTVGVVTRPFGFEGSRRRDAAEAAIAALGANTDALVVISNDRLLSQLPHGTPMGAAFAAADETLRQAICAVAEIVMDAGLINVDFNDLRAVMSNAGPSLVGIGVAEGSAADAARAAIACPLLETAAADAQGIVFNVCGGRRLSLREVHAAADAISSIVSPDANIIFGAARHGVRFLRRA